MLAPSSCKGDTWIDEIRFCGTMRSEDGVSAGAVQMVKQTSVRVAPTPLAEGPWRAGTSMPSSRSWSTKAVVSRSASTGRGRSGPSQDDKGNPVWTVVVPDVSERSLLWVLIDGETDQVLSRAS